MDAIYGGRPTSNGREGALDSATPLLLKNTIEDDSLSTIDLLALSTCNDDNYSSQGVLAASPPRRPTPSASSCTTTPQRVLTGKRKRSLHHQEHLPVLREMLVADIEQQELNRAQRERHLQMALEEAKQAREQEAASKGRGTLSDGCFQSSIPQCYGDAYPGNERPTGIKLSCCLIP
ncbi:uncharacterized protein Hap1MRO34_005796 [Clarias gariepinus]